MGANQFFRDFRREWEVQKSIAHRNNVMVRMEKRNEKMQRCLCLRFVMTKSRNKVESHHKLQWLNCLIWRRNPACCLHACGTSKAFHSLSSKIQLKDKESSSWSRLGSCHITEKLRSQTLCFKLGEITHTYKDSMCRGYNICSSLMYDHMFDFDKSNS